MLRTGTGTILPDPGEIRPRAATLGTFLRSFRMGPGVCQLDAQLVSRSNLARVAGATRRARSHRPGFDDLRARPVCWPGAFLGMTRHTGGDPSCLGRNAFGPQRRIPLQGRAVELESLLGAPAHSCFPAGTMGGCPAGQGQLPRRAGTVRLLNAGRRQAAGWMNRYSIAIGQVSCCAVPSRPYPGVDAHGPYTEPEGASRRGRNHQLHSPDCRGVARNAGGCGSSPSVPVEAAARFSVVPVAQLQHHGLHPSGSGGNPELAHPVIGATQRSRTFIRAHVRRGACNCLQPRCHLPCRWRLSWQFQACRANASSRPRRARS